MYVQFTSCVQGGEGVGERKGRGGGRGEGGEGGNEW